MIDYKFAYIKRDDKGFIEEVGARFFEGTYEEIEGKQIYKRNKRLKNKEVPNSVAGHALDTSGNPLFIYTKIQFGEIKEDDELRAFLNSEMLLDERESIKEQVETSVKKLKKLKIK